MLGDDYHFAEVGFDVPLPGAVDQPWHRDFPMPAATRDEHRLTSLAFNLTLVDTTADMGPFEIAVGTQWDDSPEFDHGMFPPKSHHGRYEGSRSARCRSAVTSRCARRSPSTAARRTTRSCPARCSSWVRTRPTPSRLVEHSPRVTHGFWDALPQQVRDHLRCPVVDRLEPIVQKHTIEGLVMGAS
ncbi:hypothetical protein GCM10025868_10120 [Angustibacter aerolatus]|uniref:Uncharacterized protein n=1 Tax=Angustibacter aerolatus TaxID=1162965 RepID=A0ABQ6JDA6_9ACTN|nr:hypothetical protein GCM10025868_10120 [Angustibacter aerolatus]